MSNNSKFKRALFASVLLGATALTVGAIQAATLPIAASAPVEAKHKLAATEAKEVEGTKADVKEDKAEANKKADAVEDKADAMKQTAKKADASEDKAQAKVKHAHAPKVTKEKI